ncbi:hypothetical protein F4820DRAFT_449773 [Hypoxylon rubiginosum]|uniref:Uncharacterized protein n=1 Tax=Hypoxylon rubiginosum TaxID=110542 RepID=A0ACB9YW90_9PEZI|nr:hypothetical protein F4820DRAFT_449773 [Hypoxylon rubiginosum]
MEGDGFYFDASGPVNYKAPWLTFSSGELPLQERQPEKSEQPHQQELDPSNPSDEDQDKLPPRKRQRLRYSNQAHVVSLLSSDDEHISDPKLGTSSISARHSPNNQPQRPTIPPRVSASEGMAAAKRLSRAATRSTFSTETAKPAAKPAISVEKTRQPLGIRRFGGHTNSFEIRNHKLLVEVGIEKPGSKRSGLSDPNALESLADEITEYIIPDLLTTESGLSSTSPPPSSYIPLDVD